MGHVDSTTVLLASEQIDQAPARPKPRPPPIGATTVAVIISLSPSSREEVLGYSIAKLRRRPVDNVPSKARLAALSDQSRKGRLQDLVQALVCVAGHELNTRQPVHLELLDEPAIALARIV